MNIICVSEIQPMSQPSVRPFLSLFAVKQKCPKTNLWKMNKKRREGEALEVERAELVKKVI